MLPISGKTRALTWLAAANSLFSARSRINNVILEVERPGLADSLSASLERRVGRFLEEQKCLPIQSVAETIFPATEYRLRGLAGVFRYPTDVFPLISSLPENSRGTYAQRLTHRICADGTVINPLEIAINKLRRQLRKPGAQRAIYELDVCSDALELKLYDLERDRENVRGGQCLSHISLKIGEDGTLCLTALYRYQFFVMKALGNLLGLARLQECIAREVGLKSGALVCHATLAVLEDSSLGVGVAWKRSMLRDLLVDCNSLAQAEFT